MGIQLRMVWKGYDQEIVQKRIKGIQRNSEKSLCALFFASQTPGALIEIWICCKSSPYPCGNILVIVGYYIFEHTTPKTKTLKFKRAQL